jgi:hypothetical protein
MAKRTTEPVAEICLYGNGQPGCGAGWLAHVGPLTSATKLLGDGEPKQTHTFTDAIFSACDAISRSGVSGGLVRVYAAGGGMMADTDLNHPRYFGDLQWVPATMLVISAEAIEAAAV